MSCGVGKEVAEVWSAALACTPTLDSQPRIQTQTHTDPHEHTYVETTPSAHTSAQEACAANYQLTTVIINEELEKSKFKNGQKVTKCSQMTKSMKRLNDLNIGLERF